VLDKVEPGSALRSALPALMQARALAAPYPTQEKKHHHDPDHCDAQLHAEPDGIQ